MNTFTLDDKETKWKKWPLSNGSTLMSYHVCIKHNIVQELINKSGNNGNVEYSHPLSKFETQ